VVFEGAHAAFSSQCAMHMRGTKLETNVVGFNECFKVSGCLIVETLEERVVAERDEEGESGFVGSNIFTVMSGSHCFCVDVAVHG
jgi:hypothetical protein